MVLPPPLLPSRRTRRETSQRDAYTTTPRISCGTTTAANSPTLRGPRMHAPKARRCTETCLHSHHPSCCRLVLSASAHLLHPLALSNDQQRPPTHSPIYPLALLAFHRSLGADRAHFHGCGGSLPGVRQAQHAILSHRLRPPRPLAPVPHTASQYLSHHLPAHAWRGPLSSCYRAGHFALYYGPPSMRPPGLCTHKTQMKLESVNQRRARAISAE